MLVWPLWAANRSSIPMSSENKTLPLILNVSEVSNSFQDLLNSRQFMKDIQSNERNIFSIMCSTFLENNLSNSHLGGICLTKYNRLELAGGGFGVLECRSIHGDQYCCFFFPLVASCEVVGYGRNVCSCRYGKKQKDLVLGILFCTQASRGSEWKHVKGGKGKLSNQL